MRIRISRRAVVNSTDARAWSDVYKIAETAGPFRQIGVRGVVGAVGAVKDNTASSRNIERKAI